MGSISYQPNIASQVSHDLRIPLTGILGMTYFLNKTQLTPEQKRYVSIIEAEVTRLLALEDKLHTLVQNH